MNNLETVTLIEKSHNAIMDAMREAVEESAEITEWYKDYVVVLFADGCAKIRTRLVGYDDWLDEGTHGEAVTFFELPSGTYSAEACEMEIENVVNWFLKKGDN